MERPVLATNVPLAGWSTLGIGGSASWLLRARDTEDLSTAHAWAADEQRPLFVLGGGSNVVIADAGFAGLVVRMEVPGCEFTQEGSDTLITAGAGEPWDQVVEAAVARGLSGIECLSGIPGSVGGTPIQNVGAYGQEVASSIECVEALDRATGRMTTMDARSCGFDYRTSRFKTGDAERFIVSGVTFRLRPGPPCVRYPDVARHLSEAGITKPTLQDVRAAVIAVRRTKGMVVDVADPDSHSVGSFFTNPVLSRDAYEAFVSREREEPPVFTTAAGAVKMPAAWLIERAGFRKGYVDGGVGLSSKHPLAIINRGGGTAEDVVRLALAIQGAVRERFGVTLRPEPVFVGFDGDGDVERLRRDQP